MKRRIAGVIFVLVVVFALAPSGAFASGTRPSFGMLGAVPRRGAALGRMFAADTTATRTARRRGNLLYHGGAILKLSTTHAIFWDPSGHSFPNGYEAVIEQYFTDVAADSGGRDNVYSVGTQYFDKKANGAIKDHANYHVIDGGPILDSDPFPLDGCTGGSGYTNCINDSQIQTEVLNVATTRGLNDIYFMFLPPGVDTCLGGNQCASNAFCAYHSGFFTSNGIVLYANQPYASVSNIYGSCVTGDRPNSSDADDTLNVVSHEHNETITDPTGRGWFARSGLENGDKCDFNFGPLIGAGYNQIINGDRYYLQQEWSNRKNLHGCRQRL